MFGILILLGSTAFTFTLIGKQMILLKLLKVALALAVLGLIVFAGVFVWQKVRSRTMAAGRAKRLHLDS